MQALKFNSFICLRWNSQRLTLPIPVRLVALALVSQALPAAAAVKPESGFGLPHDVSQNGHLIDWLMNITHVFNIILDGNLFVNAISDLDKEFWNFDKVAADPRTVRLEINAHQWAWDARYAGPDGKFNTEDDIVTWNDIKVPLGTPIYVQLTATDVIHSFYLPNLRVKMDAVPGQINRMWFQAKELGEYDIGCAQHCGTHHYKMKAQLTVLPVDQYNQWQQLMS